MHKYNLQSSAPRLAATVSVEYVVYNATTLVHFLSEKKSYTQA